ncbi:MAG: hypothetical protein Q8P20_00275 [bacterium]|nr:hypothetical protein [bacterium]
MNINNLLKLATRFEKLAGATTDYYDHDFVLSDSPTEKGRKDALSKFIQT